MSRARKRPTVAFVEEVCKYIRAGAPTEVAFRITLGAQWAIGFEWLAVATGDARPELLRRAPYKLLLDSVVKAEAEAEMRHVAILQRGQQQKWSAWWLARRHPSRWSATDRTEITVTTTPHVTRSGAIIQLPEDLARSLRALRSEKYVDPRALPEGDEPEAATEPPVVIEDVIDVRPGCDRPHTDDPEDIEAPRPPRAIPEVTKRPVL